MIGRPFVTVVALACSVGLTAEQDAGPTSAPDVTRVSGRIAASQQWGGTVWVIDDVTIDGATVTVAPGSVIEFCGARDGAGPALRFGRGERPGRLLLSGEKQRPIIVRSRPDFAPGRIEGAVAGALAWRYLRFERLGRKIDVRRGEMSRRQLEPGLRISLADMQADFVLEECTFEQCARLVLDAGAGGRTLMRDNQWSQSAENAALELRGERTLDLCFERNRIDAAVSIESTRGVFDGNVIIGERASLSIGAVVSPSNGGSHEGEPVVRRNVVHNTTSKDDGSYAASFDDAGARVEDNLFRGGTYVVLRAPRRMSRNALIAAPRLEGSRVKQSRTHHVVSELPPGAQFEHNIVIGPAFSLICTASRRRASADPAGGADIVIDHCVLDGREATGSGVHLNRGGSGERLSAAITNCLFMHCGFALADDARLERSIRSRERNAYVPKYTAKLAGGRSVRPEAGSIEIATPRELKLAAYHQALAEIPADALWQGREAPERAIAAVFRAYAPLPGSPLIHKGSDGASAIGASDPRKAAPPETRP